MMDFYVFFMGLGISEVEDGTDPRNMRAKREDINLHGGYRKLLAKPLSPVSVLALYIY
jgi:hypothetical protein